MDSCPRISRSKALEVIVNEMERGSTYLDTLDKIGQKWTLPRSTYRRYWKEAEKTYLQQKKEHDKKMAPILEEKQTELVKAVIDTKIANIVTRTERMEIASRIARGHARKIGNELIIPTGAEQLKALDYLSKIDGDYAPEKIDVTQREIRPIEFVVINAENAKTIDTD